jgi:hypothetical protein
MKTAKTRKTLADLNKDAKTVAHPDCEVSPQTERYEYRVGTTGTSYAGRTGSNLHLVRVSIVVAFDAKKEAKAVAKYPARKDIRWAKVGEISGAYPVCRTNGRSSLVEGLDTDAITCDRCVKRLEVR